MLSCLAAEPGGGVGCVTFSWVAFLVCVAADALLLDSWWVCISCWWNFTFSALMVHFVAFCNVMVGAGSLAVDAAQRSAHIALQHSTPCAVGRTDDLFCASKHSCVHSIHHAEAAFRNCSRPYVVSIRRHGLVHFCLTTRMPA